VRRPPPPAAAFRFAAAMAAPNSTF